MYFFSLKRNGQKLKKNVKKCCEKNVFFSILKKYDFKKTKLS